MPGPALEYCDFLHYTKYRLPAENHDRFAIRFSTALADSPSHYDHVLDITNARRFYAAGRIQAWAGSPKIVTPYNCFVGGVINDSFVDEPDVSKGENPEAISIMDAAKETAQTMRQGGGIGHDWSTLRPGGDIIEGVKSVTDGPIAFMPVMDAICKATSSAGNRRGAMMCVLRVDHPDIERYIVMKNNKTFLTGYNTSIGITDEFMEAVARGSTFALRFKGRVYKEVDARELWAKIMESTYWWAEPGVLFIDTINRLNNLYYCETIAATNPCGEQPLPPYGACLLGSFVLPHYLVKDAAGYYFDYKQLAEDIPHVVRMMDNVIDKATYPLAKQAYEAKSKRRMGLGVLGLANAIEACGHPYGSLGFTTMQNKIMALIEHDCYRASIQLAKEKGAFPLFDADLYLAGERIKQMPDDIRDGIRRYGIRNSHLTSVAPTGTISFCLDNMSSGIEPVFAIESERTVKMPDGEHTVTLKDYGFQFLGHRGRTTAQCTVQDHLNVLLTAAKHVDSAVSKTINMDKRTEMPEFMAIYQTAYEGGAKGCTTFNKDGLRWGIMVDKDGEEEKPVAHTEPAASTEPETTKAGEACYYDPTTGTRSCE